MLVGNVEIDEPFGGSQKIGSDLGRFRECLSGLGRVLREQHRSDQLPRLRIVREQFRHLPEDPHGRLAQLLRQISGRLEVIRVFRLGLLLEQFHKRVSGNCGAALSDLQLGIHQHRRFVIGIEFDRLVQAAFSGVGSNAGVVRVLAFRRKQIGAGELISDQRILRVGIGQVLEFADGLVGVTLGEAEEAVLEHGLVVDRILRQDALHPRGAILILMLGADDLHRKHPRRQVIGIFRGHRIQGCLRFGGRPSAKLEVRVAQPNGGAQRTQINGGFECLICLLQIIAIPGEVRDREMGDRRVRIKFGSGPEFAFGAGSVLLAQRKDPCRKVISGAVLILGTQLLDEFAGIFSIVRGGGAGQDDQCLLVPQPLVEHRDGGVMCPLQIAYREAGLADVKQQFKVIRAKLGGSLEQLICLRQLGLVIIDEGQLPQRHGVIRAQPQHFAVTFFGLIIKFSGKLGVGAGQQLILRRRL